MTPKNEVELKRERDRSSGFETVGAWLIVGALVTEAIGIWHFFTPEKSFGEAIFLTVVNLAIAAGVYAEIHFGRRASSAADSLQQLSDQRLTEALNRAARAEQDLFLFGNLDAQ